MDNNRNNPDKNSNQKPTRNPNNLLNIIIFGSILTLAINMLFDNLSSNSKMQVTYSQFVKLVDSKIVSRVEINPEEYLISIKENSDTNIIKNILITEDSTENPNLDEQIESMLEPGSVFYTGRVEDDPNFISRLLDNNVEIYKPIVKSSPIRDFILAWVLPFAIMYGLYYLFMRSIKKRMGTMDGGFGNIMGGVGKSNAKLYDMEKNTGITFRDVAGEDEAKESLDEIVDFLHNPEKYQEIGAKQPKGALLVGPPGTGKTLLAKAVAGEARVPFFSLSGSEFVEMFVGVGASRVRDLFKQAGKHAPCIVFIDEIDAIGKSRDNSFTSNDEREQTLNQLLSEMDGFDTSKGIMVLGATNRPEVLDKALLRPGRFDRRIIVERPDLPGRESILRVHANKVKMDSSCNLREIALVTSGASGADLANMINEAALRAVRMKRKRVMQEDLMEAVEVVFAGKEKKDRIMSPKEKLMVSFHEVGHALVAALEKDGQPVQKITIIPRTMGSLGYTMTMPEEERYLKTKDDLLREIIIFLGGRAAEEIEFNQSSTGASDDIDRATKIARSMVTQYGMSEKFDMVNLESIQNEYLDGRPVSNYSESTGSAIDDEVRLIIKGCHDRALNLLNENRLKLQEIAKYLYEKETLTGAEFMDILSK